MSLSFRAGITKLRLLLLGYSADELREGYYSVPGISYFILAVAIIKWKRDFSCFMVIINSYSKRFWVALKVGAYY